MGVESPHPANRTAVLNSSDCGASPIMTVPAAAPS